MGRAPCCSDHEGLKKGPWTPDEDQKLIDFVQTHGLGNWRTLPKRAGLQRCGKSCRLRWTNYLRPDIKRGTFSPEEELSIIRLHSVLGNKWSAIASHLPGRTDNEIKNYWNTKLKKRLLMMGIDPVTHRPMPSLPNPFLSPSFGEQAVMAAAMAARWKTAILEAEIQRLAAATFANASSSAVSEPLPSSSSLAQNFNFFNQPLNNPLLYPPATWPLQQQPAEPSFELPDLDLETDVKPSNEEIKVSEGQDWNDMPILSSENNNKDQIQSCESSDAMSRNTSNSALLDCTDDGDAGSNYWMSLLNLVDETPSF